MLTESARDTVEVFFPSDKVRSAAFSNTKGLGRSLLIKRGNLGAAAKGITDFLCQDEGLDPGASDPLWLLQQEEGVGEPQTLEKISAQVHSGKLKDWQNVQHILSRCWMPVWLAFQWHIQKSPEMPHAEEVRQAMEDESTGMDIDMVVQEVATAREGGHLNPMDADEDLGEILGEGIPAESSAMDITLEGDAFLIIAPDSNVLMHRSANLLRFNDLLDSVGSHIVEGQGSLTFTAKILFPFTVTQELDRMKDPRSGKPENVMAMCRKALQIISQCPFEHRAIRESRAELRQLIAHMNEGEGLQPGNGSGLLRLNNDDFILKTCEVWADRLSAAGKHYRRVIVITEDSGMLAKAKHDGRVTALRVKELPSTKEALKELMFDKGLLDSLPSQNRRSETLKPTEGSAAATLLSLDSHQDSRDALPSRASLHRDYSGHRQNAWPPPLNDDGGQWRRQQGTRSAQLYPTTAHNVPHPGLSSLESPWQDAEPDYGHSRTFSPSLAADQTGPTFPDFNQLPAAERERLKTCLLAAAQHRLVDFSALPRCPSWLRSLPVMSHLPSLEPKQSWQGTNQGHHIKRQYSHASQPSSLYQQASTSSLSVGSGDLPSRTSYSHHQNHPPHNPANRELAARLLAHQQQEMQIPPELLPYMGQQSLAALLTPQASATFHASESPTLANSRNTQNAHLGASNGSLGSAGDGGGPLTPAMLALLRSNPELLKSLGPGVL